MASLPQPEVILTHESDLDGLLSGLLLQRLAQHAFNTAVPLQAFHNNNWRQRPLNEKAAWVCDLAFEPRLDRPNWVIIDHHPKDAQPRHARLIHDPAKSAALLCYELLVEAGLGSERLARLVHLSNVADLFLVDDPYFDLGSDYANLVKTYGFWNLRALLEGEPERLLDNPLLRVMQIKREVEDPIGLAWSRDHITRISPTVGLVETVIGNTNRIVHELLERAWSPYPVLITLLRRGNGTYVASVRSRGGEAARIASKLQGGGHANASGATLPRSVQSLPDAIHYLRQILDPAVALSPASASLEGLFDAVKF